MKLKFDEKGHLTPYKGIYFDKIILLRSNN